MSDFDDEKTSKRNSKPSIAAKSGSSVHSCLPVLLVLVLASLVLQLLFFLGHAVDTSSGHNLRRHHRGSKFDVSDLEERVKAVQDSLVDGEFLSFTQVEITKDGRTEYSHSNGFQDIASNTPATASTVSRLWSMTKPVTVVAAMILYEEGKFQISDPVYRYFGDAWRKENLQVFEDDPENASGTAFFAGGRLVTLVPCEYEITVKHILTHTAGFSYGFNPGSNPADLFYFTQGFLDVSDRDNNYENIEAMMDALIQMPLLYQPGLNWEYSFAIDVVGYLVEVTSGMSYQDFVKERILDPLGMDHSGFTLSNEDLANFATRYTHVDSSGGLVPTAQDISIYEPGQTLFKGGESMAGTISDYTRFCQMLVNGGELDGTRILGKRTVDWLSRNHLRDPITGLPSSLNEFRVGENPFPLVKDPGFAFGMAVLIDPTATETMITEGSYFWGGLDQTLFWIDPREQITVVFHTQIFPDLVGIDYRARLISAVYSSLV